MTRRISDTELVDVLALAGDYLQCGYMAVQGLDSSVTGPLLLVLGDAEVALDKAKAELEARYAERLGVAA